jgi:hypothetical protein
MFHVEHYSGAHAIDFVIAPVCNISWCFKMFHVEHFFKNFLYTAKPI